KVLNPDVSAIGDFLGAVGRDRVRAAGFASSVGPVRSLELHESEVAFQSIIDPYARGDFFLSFGESGVHVVEGYLTFPSRPGGFVGKVGRIRRAFGQV